MSFLEVQDLATVAAQADLWRLITRCYEFENLLDALELAALAMAVALLLKRRKINL